MKFEIGKRYRDGRGEVYLVIAIEEDGSLVAKDAVYGWEWNFTADGTFFWHGGDHDRPKGCDLVEEVI